MSRPRPSDPPSQCNRWPTAPPRMAAPFFVNIMTTPTTPAQPQPAKDRHAAQELDFDMAVRALLRAERLSTETKIWDPVAGDGAIARALRNHGHGVICSDAHAQEFPLHFVGAFTAATKMPAGCGSVVSAPRTDIEAFVAHALELSPAVYLLTRLSRTRNVDRRHLARIHVLGQPASSFAWFCFRQRHAGPTILDLQGGAHDDR
jgi:hypothetical protein